MQRYSPLNSSIGLKGLRGKPAIDRVQPPAGDQQQREPGTGLLIADANGALLVEAPGSCLPALLSEHLRRCAAIAAAPAPVFSILRLIGSIMGVLLDR